MLELLITSSKDTKTNLLDTNSVSKKYSIRSDNVFFNVTHVTEEIDEGIIATVGHGQHMAAEPDHIDVLVTENIIKIRVNRRALKVLRSNND